MKKDPGEGNECGYDTFNGTCYETKADYDAAVKAAGAAEAKEAADNEEAAEKATADAKALMKALTAGDGSTNSNATTFATSSLNIEAGASDSAPAIPLKKDSSATVAALGDWKGTKYTGKQGEDDAAQSAEAVIYSSQGTADPISFAEYAGGTGNGLGTINSSGAYPLTVAETGTNIGGDEFPTRGRETYEGADREFSGTYNGVRGTYECTGAEDSCTAAFRGEDGILLAGSWTFKPVAGATVTQDASTYLYFGWWVRKDDDGDPTNVGVVHAGVGIGSANRVSQGDIDAANLIGEATYTGGAAGKYAVNDPFDATKDDHGHFTADASLTANFVDDGGESTLKGTIDGFRLNDGTADPGWKVMLKEAENGTGVRPDDAAQQLWSGTKTEWHIGDAKGAEGGEWEASMYRMVADSGNNTPDTVIGSFHSEIGSTHQMSGAFGAELDD